MIKLKKMGRVNKYKLKSVGDKSTNKIEPLQGGCNKNLQKNLLNFYKKRKDRRTYRRKDRRKQEKRFVAWEFENKVVLSQ